MGRENLGMPHQHYGLYQVESQVRQWCYFASDMVPLMGFPTMRYPSFEKRV